MVPSGNALTAIMLRCPQRITRADAQQPAAFTVSPRACARETVRLAPEKP
jgi:hypothetical protein